MHDAMEGKLIDAGADVAVGEKTTPQPDPNALARSRAATCHAALSKVLAEYDCRIVPMLAAPEAVGAEGAAMLVRAAYAIIPNL